jgi:GNAT superfamily N-acetyltransferase
MWFVWVERDGESVEQISLRPADIERDFGHLADWFNIIEEAPTSEPALREDYERHKDQIICLTVAEEDLVGLLGFTWAARWQGHPDEAYFYLFVSPARRRQGIGRRLYAGVEAAARDAQVTLLQIILRDDCPEYRAFAEWCGFAEKRHSIGMALDLAGFDDRPYNALLDRLRGEGFQFTTMEALGNSEEAQRRLYQLNDTAAADTPGSEGTHPWVSFEDFQKSVCGSPWYKPAAQMVVIDSANGDWASMSAITRFEGADHAYNLFTGTDWRYRGRKLAQAVKVLALRYARDVLKVTTVRTHHNSTNLPMITIDRKLGYVQIPGNLVMQKLLA